MLSTSINYFAGRETYFLDIFADQLVKTLSLANNTKLENQVMVEKVKK